MTMLERLNNLTVDQRRLLQYAFEGQFGQFVEIDDDHFVGVNIGHIKHLEILESAGSWSYGVIHKGDEDAS